MSVHILLVISFFENCTHEKCWRIVRRNCASTTVAQIIRFAFWTIAGLIIDILDQKSMDEEKRFYLKFKVVFSVSLSVWCLWKSSGKRGSIMYHTSTMLMSWVNEMFSFSINARCKSKEEEFPCISRRWLSKSIK